MAIYWGYYCKTCDLSSARWEEDPRVLRQYYLQLEDRLQSVYNDEPLRQDTVELEPFIFLTEHYRHELWVETELAQLALPKKDGESDG